MHFCNGKNLINDVIDTVNFEAFYLTQRKNDNFHSLKSTKKISKREKQITKKQKSKSHPVGIIRKIYGK